HVNIMDYVDGEDRIKFCGCTVVTRIITKGGNARIYKNEDLQAVVMGTTANDLAMDGYYIS
ncbi:MAG: hypothetical protein AB8B36_00005, partial [Prochlorococcus sp.]